MMATFRAIASVPLGVVAGMAARLLLLIPCFLMYPLPSGIDAYDPADAEAFGKYMSALPLQAFGVLLVAHSGGTFLGAAMGRLISGERFWSESLAIGGIFTAVGLVNAVSLSFPLWFVLIDLPLYLPAAVLGGFLPDAFRSKRHEPEMPIKERGAKAAAP